MKKLIALCMAAALCLSALSACGPKPAEEKKADLAAFAQSVQEKHEFSSLEKADPADEEFGVIMLENAYPGLKDLDLEQVEVYLAMVSFSGGELAMVQAKNAEDADKVREIFQARIDYMAGDGETPGGAWYPGPTELWNNSARVKVNGNYVLMVTSEDCDQIVDEFNALFA